MQKRPDYLKRYADRYRLVRREDGVWYILTLRPDAEGMTYDVYGHSDEMLAACLPPRAANHLLKRYPGTFTAHQDADDAMVLLFKESLLDELADGLKLRRKKQISEDERQRLAELSGEHSEAGLVKLAERRRHLSESRQTA
jgi:hypothetical protein